MPKQAHTAIPNCTHFMSLFIFLSLSPPTLSPSPHSHCHLIPALTLAQVARRHKATETNGSSWKQLNAEIYLGKQRYVCVTGHYVFPSTYLQALGIIKCLRVCRYDKKRNTMSSKVCVGVYSFLTDVPCICVGSDVRPCL